MSGYITKTTLPMQRPDFFNNQALNSVPATRAEKEERDRVVQMRKDYNEVDRAVSDMKARMARVQKLESQEPGRVKVREGHWLGNYGRLFVNSELNFNPETGIPSRFYQHHEGAEDFYSYRNQGGVESLVCSPTRAGTSYELDHNQGTITISRQNFSVESASNGGWGGVYAAGVARREQKKAECEIALAAGAGAAAGVLLGAGLGAGLGYVTGKAIIAATS